MSFISEHLDTILVGAVALFLAVERFMSGSSGLKKEIAAEYKERNEQLEKKWKDADERITATNLIVAELKGTINEKDKHIDSLTKILQDKNPEVLNLLEKVSASNIKIQEFMMTMHKVLTEELSVQTSMMREDHERAKKIDLATASHKGDPIRMPRSRSKAKKTK